jgi:hypothetical protein
LGYAYVNFHNVVDGKSKRAMSHVRVNGWNRCSS